MNKQLRFVFSTLFILLLGGCGKQISLQIDPDLVLATYDDSQITARDTATVILEKNQYDRILLLSAEGKVPSAIQIGLPGIAHRRIIAQRAREEGLDETESFKDWRTDMVNRELGKLVLDIDTVVKINVTEEDVENYYRNNPSRYTEPATYTFRGMISLDEKWGREKARERMEKAVSELKEGKDFEEVAEEYSDSAPRVRGRPQKRTQGEAGMPPEIEEALLSLEVGEYTPIIERPKGLAVYQLIDRTKEEKVPLTPVLRMQIRSEIFRERSEREEQILVERLVQQNAVVYKPELLVDPEVSSASVVLEVRGLPPVTLEDLREKGNLTDEMTTTERRNAFDGYAASLLLLTEARRRGYEEADVAARVEYYATHELQDRYVRHLLGKDEITVQQLRDYYEQNRQEFVSKPRYRLYQIFIEANIREDMSTFEQNVAFDTARAQAQQIYNQITSGDLTFEQAARAYSSDRVTAAQGGFVGEVTLNQLGTEFLTFTEIAPRLEEGVVTEPRLANYDKDHLGYDIYFCPQITPAHQLRFEEAVSKVGQMLAEKRKEELLRSLQDEITRQYPLRIDNAAVERFAADLAEIRRSSASPAELIKAILPPSRLEKLDL